MTLVQHHVKYKELHGIDEIVMMEESEHRLLHTRLRKEGKCALPAEELNKISNRAYQRSPQGKARRKEFYKKTRQVIRFNQSLDINILLCERIIYNSSTGNVRYTYQITGRNDRKILRIDIN